MAAWQALPKEQRPGSSLPALCHRNTQWWSRTYGHGNKPVANEKSSPFDAFYRAIRDNQVERVQSYIAQNPTAVFTKVFGENQRTALYVASFFGRHKVVKLLLHRGADKNLQCHGVRPIDVAGFASTDPIDRMKALPALKSSCG
ncbi:hypothetical protein F441_17642 [Phytophthora nicotianae CJ01A1]|uniref:Uncharacterized protein n=5 Tax=Phytophthora nicotianae TaxID=4792 RepID=W2QZS9_PHYN3|nr:hypothetical protein PPTG_04168 [Phytophthora nicotianae INRA-310]ETK76268.1 hypothetical protein L915_17294 [Phytophthora nicotianae]ETO64739.1 hypothetical protein F444_17802 [Phytophthora nicotianae P1976]ETP05826.1 hypothetical protein F441_17642 [Phytophthora nicotianae CJ01A1]ETP33933.1 hypothetical protein F442_17619 [Phytophthora nicotianae P10297]ETL82929.1 hypothetical protein L917_17022 [Phytophthora nicotianae]